MKHLRVSVLLFSSVVALSFASAQAPETHEESVEARVTEVLPATCGSDNHACFLLKLIGTSTTVDGRNFDSVFDPQSFLGADDWTFKTGDRVIVQKQTIDGEERFYVSDIVRRPILLWLFFLFFIVVVGFGGLSALKSFLGMAVSFVILFAFILPAILSGTSPVIASTVGALAIMTVTLVLSHGLHPKTFAALAGTGISLLCTALLAILFSSWSRLFGLADENVTFLLGTYPDMDSRGLLLAGIIIGALGVLDDLTISQASAVFELRRANHSLSPRELYKRAINIGRDHISAAVNTLILAYAGASLPLLLLLTSSPIEPWWILINREVIATEIIRTLVGSIGLLIAVPSTTALASLLVHRLPKRYLEDEHGHAHSH